MVTYFLQNGTYITGTIRDTRKQFPVELKTVTLKKEKQHFTKQNGLVVVKYRAVKDRAAGKYKWYMFSIQHMHLQWVIPAKGIKMEMIYRGNMHKCLESQHGRKLI